MQASFGLEVRPWAHDAPALAVLAAERVWGRSGRSTEQGHTHSHHTLHSVSQMLLDKITAPDKPEEDWALINEYMTLVPHPRPPSCRLCVSGSSQERVSACFLTQ